MLFSSITFLYYFLPWILLIYFLSGPYKNLALLISSLVFYAWGEPKYVLLMAGVIVIGYVFGILVEKFREMPGGKFLAGCFVFLCVGILFYYKLPGAALPVGISFYIFQVISYVIDVRRGQKPQKNFVDLAAYISMFPQLAAGPIVRYSQIEKQLADRTHSFEMAAGGITRFVTGLSKKVILANTLGEFAGRFPDSNQPSLLSGWLYAIAVALQIYFDFSGYSDMAIGLGKIFGFSFPENFNYPFLSRSVAEFWRRWHMSLGYWFRDYLYIPLGGSRVSFPRYVGNVILVWLSTGLWHGLSWNFVAWGLYFALFLILEKLWLGKILEKLAVFSRCYLLFVVVTSFVIFQAGSLKEAVGWAGMMFGIGVPLVTKEGLFFLRDYGGVLFISVIGSTPLVKHILKRIGHVKTGERVLCILEPVYLITAVLVVTSFLVKGSYNPFLYFRF
ncbi:MAG: MBOAT family protein [Roseburia sp.]|nr:MBOAT family protein [Roseburia sp.]